MRETIETDRLVDMVNGRLSPEHSLELLKQIENDPEASSRLDVVAGLTTLAVEEPELFSESTQRAGQASWANRVGLLMIRMLAGRRPAFRFGIAGAVVGVLSFCLMILHPWSDPYVGLVDLHGIGTPLQLRGTADEDVRQAQELAADGEHRRAIAILERRLRVFSQDEMSDYVHYSAGLLYLLSAERSWLMFRSFDRELVRGAVDHLDAAMRVTSSARLREDSRWFLAQSYLALPEPDSARAQLAILAEHGGLRAPEAIRQIKIIDGLLTGR